MVEVERAQGGPADALAQAEAGAAAAGRPLHDRWSASGGGGVIDLVIDREADIEAIVAAAARRPGPPSILVMALADPTGLRSHLTRGAGSRPDRVAGRPLDRAAIAAVLARHDFGQPRWLVAYPDHRVPQVIIDSRLWDEPGGDLLANAIVRQPVSFTGQDGPPASDPRQAFQAASAAGRALDVADSLIVAAIRGGRAGDRPGREGRAWLLPPQDRVAAWAVTRELRRAGEGWQLAPLHPTSAQVSGPLLLEPSPVAVPLGRSGEDELSAALLAEGFMGAGTRRVLEDWWQAVEREIDGLPAGQLPLASRPRDFVISGAGEWCSIAHDLFLRVPLPREALAYGALVHTLAESVLGMGPIAGMDAALSIGEAARALLISIGLRCTAEHAFLWRDVEADMASRLSAGAFDRRSARSAAEGRDGRPLWTTLPGWPVGPQLEALLAELAGLRAEASRLRREVARRDVDARVLRDELERASRRLHEAGEPASRLGAGRDTTAPPGAVQAAHQERLRSEAAWHEWQASHERSLPSRSQAGESGRSELDDERDLVEASDLFDRPWYLARYPDVLTADIDAAFHYVRHGAAEGRDPGPEFDTLAYVARHPEIAPDGINPLVHQVRSGSSGSPSPHDLTQEEIERMLPAYGSEAEYLAAVAQAQPWLSAARLVCRREVIPTGGRPEHVSATGRYPVVVMPPDHVVKLYARWRGGHHVLETETAALRRLERDPTLPVPRLVAHGVLTEEWRYCILSRVPGMRLADVQESLTEEARLNLAGWLGRFVRRLHAIPVEEADREAGWERFRAYVEHRVAELPRSVAESGALPAHLAAQVGEWLPTLDELLGPRAGAVIVHGNLMPKHVLGHHLDGTFQPTGVIDFNDSLVGHPLYDLGHMWWCALHADRRLQDAFLREAGFPGQQDPGFPRQALAWSLVRTCRRPPAIPGLDGLAGLDELASHWFGPTAGGEGAP